MKKPKRQPKQLQKQTPENEAAEQEGYRRRMNTRFLFWTVCAEGRCKRAKRCAGDGEACFQRWWPHVPEEFKQEVRAFIDGLRRGLTIEEAARGIAAKVAEWKALDEVEACEAREQRAVLGEPVNAAARGPRVRSL